MTDADTLAALCKSWLDGDRSAGPPLLDLLAAGAGGRG